MLSKFTLRIKEDNFTKEYIEKRNKEILPMSAGVAGL